MLSSEIIQHLAEQLGTTISNTQPLSGGDICLAYQLNTPNGQLFIKTNTVPSALSLFQEEAKGLQAIATTNTIATPEVIRYGQYQNTGYLILAHIPFKRPTTADFKLLGTQLAQLHQSPATYYGWDSDNYIGTLKQYNNIAQDWIDFYTQKRLYPQLELALQKGLLSTHEVPSIEQLTDRLTPYLKNTKPSLLHGDLWSGNYGIATNGTPYLIDPAVYYGHHMVDIAMTKLFGGFDQSFYKAYYDNLPPTELAQDQCQCYQLYYLLVHLNLFGTSYKASVINILRQYS